MEQLVVLMLVLQSILQPNNNEYETVVWKQRKNVCYKQATQNMGWL